MLMYLQWATDPPADWVEYDTRDWDDLPYKDPPVGSSNDVDIIDEEQGWVNALTIQGIRFTGDHYHVNNKWRGSVEVTTWWDDPEDWTPDMFYAEKWTLGKDLFQERELFLAPGKLAEFEAKGVLPNYTNNGVTQTKVHSWSDFKEPKNARHGVWMTDNTFLRHRGLAVPKDYRLWLPQHGN